MDSSIFLWALKDKKFIHNLVGHKDLITSLEFCSNKSLLLSSSWDSNINVYDLQKYL